MKDAGAFRNIARLLSALPQTGQLVVVVSAMGKTTNALEEMYQQAFRQQDFSEGWQRCRQYHLGIVQALFPDKGASVYGIIENQFQALQQLLERVEPQEFDFQYDQIISVGELLSSQILHHFLHQQGLATHWLDCRTCLRTNATWREAQVNWTQTETLIQETLPSLLKNNIVVTQGFIGGTGQGHTTTLGREGSDFSAAIFAYCLSAESMTIWKDVPGLLNADPKLFPTTICYEEIAYQEAIEMAYYGASVIHPKTVAPLAKKGIPLYVKSFLNPQEAGTVIKNCRHDRIAPAFIVKQNQCLLSFHSKDYGFVTEQNLSTIFQALSEHRLKINVMQNSAISFSVCTDYDAARVQALVENLQPEFQILYNQPLHLYTVKNYDQASLDAISEGKEILLEQRSRQTYQLVCRPAPLPSES